MVEEEEAVGEQVEQEVGLAVEVLEGEGFLADISDGVEGRGPAVEEADGGRDVEVVHGSSNEEVREVLLEVGVRPEQACLAVDEDEGGALFLGDPAVAVLDQPVVRGDTRVVCWSRAETSLSKSAS